MIFRLPEFILTTHNFIDTKPTIVILRCILNTCYSCKICTLCNLTVINRYNEGAEWYFLNDILLNNTMNSDAIYISRTSCEEMIIKSIIE